MAGWTWKSGTPKERADAVRSHARMLPDKALLDLFQLTEDGLSDILSGGPWRPEYQNNAERQEKATVTCEYAVMAETFEGNVMTLRRGFSSAEAAEDHPVQLKLWKRVWVAPTGDNLQKMQIATPALPPLPWNWVAAGSADRRGCFHAYLVDATGRKIAAIWGRDHEKKMIADTIVERVNMLAAPTSPP